MGTIVFIIIVIFAIALLCGASAGEALGGIFIAIVCIAQWALPFIFLAWLISCFI
ncbi:MAG: hypothetical protein ACRCS6_07030 [Turicibacter sp.]